MTIYYIKQDNTIWGCGDPECCGEYYEDIEESFIDCEHENVDANHLHGCNGGGPVLEWRKATPLEVIAYASGGNERYYEGWEYGEKQAESRIVKLLEQASRDFEQHDFNAVGVVNNLLARIKGETE